MNDNDMAVAFSSGNDEYRTPKWIYATLDEVFNFTLDPCSTDENHLAPKWFTEKHDGLKRSWAFNSVFVNYPYSQAAKWLEKIGDECLTSDMVVLCPVRTDTKAFQEHVFPKATAIHFFKGRLKFLNPSKEGYKPTSAPFPSCLIFYCDVSKVKQLEGKLNGHTVYL